MRIKRFYIEADGSEIIKVGLRPALIYYGTAVYNLRVVAHNLVAEDASKNRVEVIVKGDENRIELFYNDVKTGDIRPVKKGPMYQIKKPPEDYVGDEPDWDYCLNTINAEQMYMGVGAIGEINSGIKNIDEKFGSMNNSLKNIDEKFGVLIDRFGIFGEYMQRMDKKLDAHTTYLKRISSMDKSKGRRGKSRSKGKRK